MSNFSSIGREEDLIQTTNSPHEETESHRSIAISASVTVVMVISFVACVVVVVVVMVICFVVVIVVMVNCVVVVVVIVS